jgi:large subunit ribosomal protein L11
MGQVISKINEATKQFNGMKVPVELDINVSKKTFEVHVLSPPTSELLKKDLGIQKAAGDHKNAKAGNVAIEQVIAVAKTKHNNMLAKNLKAAVKTVLGSCQSSGIMVENKEAKDVSKDVDSGIYDKEIKDEKIKASPEKLAELKKFFDDLRSKQEQAKQAAKAAEEAAAAAAAATATPAAGTPAAPAAVPAAEKKKEADKGKKK